GARLDLDDREAALLLEQAVELRALARRDRRLEIPDFEPGRLELPVDDPLLLAPARELLLVLLGLLGKARFARREVVLGRLDFFFEGEAPFLGAADELLGSVDLVEHRPVLAARLDAAQRRLELLLFVLVLGEVGLGAPQLRLRLLQPPAQLLD